MLSEGACSNHYLLSRFDGPVLPSAVFKFKMTSIATANRIWDCAQPLAIPISRLIQSVVCEELVKFFFRSCCPYQTCEFTGLYFSIWIRVSYLQAVPSHSFWERCLVNWNKSLKKRSWFSFL